MTSIEWTHRPGTTGVSWNPIRARGGEVFGPDGVRRRRVGWHCEHVTEACRNCYAERQNVAAARGGTGLSYKPGLRGGRGSLGADIFLDEKTLLAPLSWKKPRTIFVCSMSDLFGAWVSNEWLDRIFAVMALTPQHTWIVLTKRPERMRDWFAERWQPAPSHMLADGTKIPAEIHGETRRTQVERACEPFLERLGLVDTERDDLWTSDGKCKAMQWAWPLPNVWLGVSVGDQNDAAVFVPLLLWTPAAVRWVSYEPALGPVDFTHLFYGNTFTDALEGMSEHGVVRTADGYCAIDPVYTNHPKLDWVVCGGESGPNARPMHPDWARTVRDDCAESGVPFFFKQWGEWGCDTGPLPDGKDPIFEAKARCAWLDDGVWKYERDGFAPPDRALSAPEWVYRLGKKRAGRSLDGATHDAWPEARA